MLAYYTKNKLIFHDLENNNEEFIQFSTDKNIESVNFSNNGKYFLVKFYNGNYKIFEDKVEIANFKYSFGINIKFHETMNIIGVKKSNYLTIYNLEEMDENGDLKIIAEMEPNIDPENFFYFYFPTLCETSLIIFTNTSDIYKWDFLSGEYSLIHSLNFFSGDTEFFAIKNIFIFQNKYLPENYYFNLETLELLNYTGINKYSNNGEILVNKSDDIITLTKFGRTFRIDLPRKIHSFNFSTNDKYLEFNSSTKSYIYDVENEILINEIELINITFQSRIFIDNLLIFNSGNSLKIIDVTGECEEKNITCEDNIFALKYCPVSNSSEYILK